MMNIWRFDLTTGDLIASMEVEPDRLALYADFPDYTTVEPPELQTGESCSFRAGAWVVGADLRGLSFHNPATGESVICREVGWVLPEGWAAGMAPTGLAEAKAAKNAEINVARMAANRSTFTFLGKEISCDELSRSDIDAVNGIVSLIGALPPGFPGAWKAVDNTYVAIADKAAWIGFYGAMVAKGTVNFAHAQTLKTLLAAAETDTTEKVEAIQW